MSRGIDTCTCTHDRRDHILVDPDRPFEFGCFIPSCTCTCFMPHPQPDEVKFTLATFTLRDPVATIRATPCPKNHAEIGEPCDRPRELWDNSETYCQERIAAAFDVCS